MGKIYTVYGITGEYSDLEEWAAVSYLNEADAVRHALLATQKAQELGIHDEPMSRNRLPLRELREVMKELDPNLELQYTGVRYRVDSNLLLEKVPNA